MKKQICIVLAVLILVSGCSWMPSMSSLNPFSGSETKEAQEDEQLGVNPYLWQASLAKLSFMPLASTDAKGGVIVTDWATMDNIQDEQFKITVNILSVKLRADCLKVIVFKRVMKNGRWENTEPDSRLADEIEKSILSEARKLYRRALAAREE